MCLLCSLPVHERQMMANRRKPEMFKIDQQITSLLKDYEGEATKQRKIVEKNNGELFYIFGTKLPTEEANGRTLGES